MGSVQYDATFAIMGGYYDGEFKDAVFLYNTTSGQFDLLDERLSKPKDEVTTFLVSEDIFPEC